EVAAWCRHGGVTVIENAEHIRPDLRVGRADQLVFVVAERLVPATEIEQGDLHVEAGLTSRSLNLLEQRLLGLCRLRTRHRESHREGLPVFHTDAVSVPLRPPRLIEQL